MTMEKNSSLSLSYRVKFLSIVFCFFFSLTISIVLREYYDLSVDLMLIPIGNTIGLLIVLLVVEIVD
jgi:hypothetical protein